MTQATDGSGNIVIVDDNTNNLRVLGEMLRQAGHQVRPAVNGSLALHAIAMIPPELVLLDIRMPGMDGYEVCRRLKEDQRTRDIPVIFISALHEAEDKLTAFQAGGVDYITKPFEVEEVLARVKTHLRLYRMQYALEGVVAERTEALRKSYESLRRSEQRYRLMLEQTIGAIALTVEKRDPYTAGHQQRVSELAVAIAGHVGLGSARVEGLRLGAMIHDIGKICVPAEILSRPGRLSPPEFELIKAHSSAGHEIVNGVVFPWPIAQMLLQHHERLDGSGYPEGLAGERIIEEARILAVADVVEAMASHRPYRPALGLKAAMDEMRSGRGRRYDPQAVDAVTALFETGQLELDEQACVRVHHPGAVPG